MGRLMRRRENTEYHCIQIIEHIPLRRRGPRPMVAMQSLSCQLSVFAVNISLSCCIYFVKDDRSLRLPVFAVYHPGP